MYSDVERLTPCSNIGEMADPGESSKIFDTPLLFLATWHIIEWLRATTLLTVVFLGVNWTVFWYFTIPNTLYGLIVFFIVHLAYLGKDGYYCREPQENRSAWLLAEIIIFWATFFLYSFPFLLTIVLGKDRVHNTLLKW